MRSCASPSARLLKRSKLIGEICMATVRRQGEGIFRSTLRPRQALDAPAADAVALAVGILVALETFEDVVAIGESRLGGGLGRRTGTVATAADEHQQRFAVDGVAQLVDEMFIEAVARIGEPLDLDRPRNASDPVEFGARADIDEPGPGRKLPNAESLLRRQGAFVGQVELVRPFLGKLENLGEATHSAL